VETGCRLLPLSRPLKDCRCSESVCFNIRYKISVVTTIVYNLVHQFDNGSFSFIQEG